MHLKNTCIIIVRIGLSIVNLTLDLSFANNLCFRRPNGHYEPILDIYVSIAFQWYKKLFEGMGFDPWNHTLKIKKSIWDSNSEHGSLLVSVKVHSLTFFALRGACDVTARSSSWPATLQPLALVASPRLRLWQYQCMKYMNYEWMNFAWFPLLSREMLYLLYFIS